MDWTVLVPVIVGGVMAALSGLAGQWVAETRAVAREERGRQHEREVWAREFRREAHLAYLTEFDATLNRFSGHPDAPERPEGVEPPDDYLDHLRELREQVALFGTDETDKASLEALAALYSLVFKRGTPEEVGVRRWAYLASIRRELGIPPSVGESV